MQVRGSSISMRVLLSSIFLVLILLATLPVAARAQAGLELSTQYPGITVTAGKDLNFQLQINNYNLASQAVNLEIVKKPEGWETSLKGNGEVIHEAYVSRNSTQTADLNIEVPEDTSSGHYRIVARADGDISGRDSLYIDVNVVKQQTGADELQTQYSELKGPGDATFKFKVDLTNNGTTERSYSLGAKRPGRGWQVAFSPAYKDKQIASLSVGAGETTGINVKITPPARVKAGAYTIPVYAVSGGNKVSTELKVIIAGNYNLKFTTLSGKLNTDIVAGGEKDVTMKVINKGSAVLNGITFSAQAPPNWSVTFDPEKINTLKPGASRQVTATIKSADKAIAGDYMVPLQASTRATQDKAEFRVTVNTSTLWGIIGLLIVVAVGAGVYGAFRYYGRR